MPDQTIQWYPGHMKKALSDMRDRLKHVDLVIEVRDARVPYSSSNPELKRLIGSKSRLLVLNKADLADADITALWLNRLHDDHLRAVACDTRYKRDLEKISDACRDIAKNILEKAKAKGRVGRPVRAMVVGIPNVGKSSVINALCSRKIATTGDRPGVTRHFQWAKTRTGLELMDMPGVLWPKISSERSQLVLYMTGAIREEITDTVTAAVRSIDLIDQLYPGFLFDRYGSIDVSQNAPYEMFLSYAKNRGCLMAGGRVDEERFARLFFDDFQSGRLGRMTLERPLDRMA